tara:strand:+ start:485 stop:823 length:339 start_codon:yes stop_codon:yes gene_type:complete
MSDIQRLKELSGIISEAPKPIAKISQGEFMDWKYSSRDDLIGLGHSVADSLKVDGTYTHDLNKEWEQTGYINLAMIQNWDEIKAQIPNEDLEQILADEEIESPATWLDVDWI